VRAASHGPYAIKTSVLSQARCGCAKSFQVEFDADEHDCRHEDRAADKTRERQPEQPQCGHLERPLARCAPQNAAWRAMQSNDLRKPLRAMGSAAHRADIQPWQGRVASQRQRRENWRAFRARALSSSKGE
jgi:hypothetical protein